MHSDAAESGSRDLAEPPRHHHVIEVGNLKPTLLRGLLLLLETVVPTLLLYACNNTVGGFWGLVAVLGWCTLTVSARVTMRQRVPFTLLMAVGGLVGRTTIALVFSNVYTYLFQPIAGSLCMAILFLGSAAIGRPGTSWHCRLICSATTVCAGYSSTCR